jgi:hypothetical protein
MSLSMAVPGLAGPLAPVLYMPVSARAAGAQTMPAFVASLTPRSSVEHVAPALPDMLEAGRIPVDTTCPCCGWPERFLDVDSRLFGCVSCSYSSDERDA